MNEIVKGGGGRKIKKALAQKKKLADEAK